MTVNEQICVDDNRQVQEKAKMLRNITKTSTDVRYNHNANGIL